MEGQGHAAGGGGEGCPSYPPAQLPHAHMRGSKAIARLAAPLEDAALLLLCCQHSSHCRWHRRKPPRRPLPWGGPARCWGEPGGAWCLSVGFSLQCRWKLAHQLLLEPVHPSRFTCGGLLGIDILSGQVSSSIIPIKVNLEKLPVTPAGSESYLQWPPLPGILPVPKACWREQGPGAFSIHLSGPQKQIPGTEPWPTTGARSRLIAQASSPAFFLWV